MIKKLTSITAAVSALALSATPVFAYENPLKCDDLPACIALVITYILGIAAGVALVLLVVGGIQYMSSGGDKMAVESAKGRITASVAGLVIVFGAWLIIKIVCTILGVEVCGLGV